MAYDKNSKRSAQPQKNEPLFFLGMLRVGQNQGDTTLIQLDADTSKVKLAILGRRWRAF